MHHVVLVQESAETPSPDRAPDGGAGNFVHSLFCHRAPQRYGVLPWWFQPSATQTGPATHDEYSMDPPRAAEGSGRVLEVVAAVAVAAPIGNTDIAINPVEAIAVLKRVVRRCRFMW
jgi:hypothetical protein